MVHDEANSLFVGIFVECRQVEVRIRRKEVENEVFLLAIPVFPTFVPTLDEQAIEAVFRGEVDVSAHVRVVGTMIAVRFRFGVVGHSELHRRIVVGV